MQEVQNNQKKDVKGFLKKNAYYFILAGIVLVLALIIGLTSLIAKPQEDTPVSTTNITFVSPVANATVSKGYSVDHQYDAVLNEWSMHKAVDFSINNGANVMASYDGKVESISTNVLDGTSIVINHGNNLKTVYKLLDEEVKVKVGDSVTSGQVIGYVASADTEETSHLHFEVWKDDALVDPAGYLNIDNK